MNLAWSTARARHQREGNVLDNAAVPQRLAGHREHLAGHELVPVGVTVLEAKELVEAHAAATNAWLHHTRTLRSARLRMKGPFRTKRTLGKTGASRGF